MAWYVVSYDLNKEPNAEDFALLIAQLRGQKAFHIQKSVWLVESEGSSEDILKSLKPHLDGNDGIFVAEISKDNSLVRHGMDKLENYPFQNRITWS